MNVNPEHDVSGARFDSAGRTGAGCGEYASGQSQDVTEAHSAPVRRLGSRIDDDDFRALDATGASAAVIAERLGVTPRTVTRWRHRLGLAHGVRQVRVGDATRAFARQLIDDGCPVHEVARTVGVSWTTIRRWFPDAPRWSPSEAGSYAQMTVKLERLEWKRAS